MLRKFNSEECLDIKKTNAGVGRLQYLPDSFRQKCEDLTTIDDHSDNSSLSDQGSTQNVRKEAQLEQKTNHLCINDSLTRKNKTFGTKLVRHENYIWSTLSSYCCIALWTLPVAYASGGATQYSLALFDYLNFTSGITLDRKVHKHCQVLFQIRVVLRRRRTPFANCKGRISNILRSCTLD